MKGIATMSSAIAKADNYTKWVLSCFGPFIGKNVLEIGTGQGNYKEFVENYEEYISIDIDENLITTAKENDPTGEYYICDITSEKEVSKFGAKRFDTVLCTNVLEHVVEHEAVFKNVSMVLKENGRFLLFVPAFQFLYSDMDKLAGHHRRYLKSELNKLAESSGFQVEVLEYFNPIGAVGWWINKFMAYDNLDDKKINDQILLFDKYILPISRLLNPITKAWWGQSVVGVFRKS